MQGNQHEKKRKNEQKCANLSKTTGKAVGRWIMERLRVFQEEKEKRRRKVD